MAGASARAFAAQVRLNLEVGLPTTLLGTGVLVALDVGLRLAAPATVDASARAALAWTVLACLAVALPLVLVGRDEPQLFLTLPVGVRATWLAKLVADLALLTPVTALAMALAGDAWGVMAPRVLAWLIATCFVLGVLALTASLLVARPISRLALGMAWCAAALGASGLVTMEGGRLGLLVTLATAVASLVLLVVPCALAAERLLTLHDRRWRVVALSFAPLVVLPVLHAANVHGPRIMGPTVPAAELTFWYGGLASARRSVAFPRLSVASTIDEPSWTVRSYGLRDPSVLSPRGGWDWTFVPRIHSFLRSDPATGSRELVAPTEAASRVQALSAAPVTDVVGGEDFVVEATRPASKSGGGVTFRTLGDERPAFTLPMDAGRASVFLASPAHFGLVELGDDGILAWARDESRLTCVRAEGATSRPVTAFEERLDRLFGPLLGGRYLRGYAKVARGPDERFLVDARSEELHAFGRGVWRYHEHGTVRAGHVALKERGEVVVLDLEASPQAVVRRDRATGSEASFSWHFVRNGELYCRVDPGQALLRLPDGVEESTLVVQDDAFVVRRGQGLVVGDLASRRTWELDAPSCGVDDLDLSEARLDPATAELRLAWQSYDRLVAARCDLDTGTWTCSDSRDVPVTWHLEP